MSTEELLAKRKAIEANPANRNAPGSLFIYTLSARRKLDKIDREIAENTRIKRIAEGKPINDAGYSGRQTNKR